MKVQRQFQFELLVDRNDNYTSFLGSHPFALEVLGCISCVTWRFHVFSCIIFFIWLCSIKFPPTGSTRRNRQRPYRGRDPKCAKTTSTIQVSSKATCYEIETMFENTVQKEVLSIVLRFPLSSDLSTVDIYRALPLHQTNQNATIASLYCFSN